MPPIQCCNTSHKAPAWQPKTPSCCRRSWPQLPTTQPRRSRATSRNAICARDASRSWRAFMASSTTHAALRQTGPLSPYRRGRRSRVTKASPGFTAGRSPHTTSLPGRFPIGPVLGLRLEPFALQFLADPAVVDVAAFDRTFGRIVPLRQPVAQRIAEPRRLRPQRREAELLPDRPRALHVFLLRQRQRRQVAFHGGVHEHGRIFFLVVLTLGAVTLPAMRHQLYVLDRVHPVGHGPEQRVGIVDVDILVDGDAYLAAITLEECGAFERAPDLGARNTFLQRDDGDP